MTTVLVVDDSKFMRTVIGNTLEDYGYDVFEASNGEQAISMTKDKEPDVITMDVEMPKMDGLEATERIMKECPTPILMLSAHTEEGADTTLNALQNGALDFVPKPDGKETTITAVEFGDGLVDAVDAVSRADVSAAESTVEDRERSSLESEAGDALNPVIIIGASTGGPSIVEDILSDLPKELAATILIVQHMPEGFTNRYAHRLNRESPYDVFEAQDGATVEPGQAVVAKGGHDLVIEAERSTGELELGVPESRTATGTSSIDATLESAAVEVSMSPVVVALLTGMGDDGSNALPDIKDAGAYVIAQNEETSPVFGIPRRAIQTGNVDEVLGDYDMVKGIVEGVEKVSRD